LLLLEIGQQRNAAPHPSIEPPKMGALTSALADFNLLTCLNPFLQEIQVA